MRVEARGLNREDGRRIDREPKQGGKGEVARVSHLAKIGMEGQVEVSAG